jgi:hypothetical protein
MTLKKLKGFVNIMTKDLGTSTSHVSHHGTNATTTTMSKCKHELLSKDTLQRKIDKAVADKPSAELAVLYLMREYDFDLDQLKHRLLGT